MRISRNITITLSCDGKMTKTRLSNARRLRHAHIEAHHIGTMRMTGGGFHLPVSASDLGA
jgi:hypothetical protein